MKNPLLPALVAIGALVGGARADAQRPQDVLLLVESLPAPQSVTVDARSAAVNVPPTIGPVAAAPTPVVRASVPTPAAVVDAPIVQGGTRMPTSRVLIFGGTAAALTGILIGGDTGAIVAVTGTASAIYGLYLHYR